MTADQCDPRGAYGIYSTEVLLTMLLESPDDIKDDVPKDMPGKCWQERKLFGKARDGHLIRRPHQSE